MEVNIEDLLAQQPVMAYEQAKDPSQKLPAHVDQTTKICKERMAFQKKILLVHASLLQVGTWCIPLQYSTFISQLYQLGPPRARG